MTDITIIDAMKDAFIDACKNNDVVKVMACVSTFGMDVNTLSQGGESGPGLVEAARRNSEDVVAWLLAQPDLDNVGLFS